MMGQQAGGQERLFYSFNLEDHVPADHLLRGIDQCLDLSELRQHLTKYYSHTGRPSIDPELMMRMLIVGYSYGIRSERRLCEEVHLNSPIAGSAVLGWRMLYRTIPPSPRIGMDDFVRAACLDGCLMMRSVVVWLRAWSREKGLRWTPV